MWDKLCFGVTVSLGGVAAVPHRGTSRPPHPHSAWKRLGGGQNSAVTRPLLRGRPSQAAATPRRSLRAPPRDPEGRSGRRRGPVPGQPPAPGPPLGGAGGEEAARGGRKRRCEGRAERPRAGERGREGAAGPGAARPGPGGVPVGSQGRASVRGRPVLRGRGPPLGAGGRCGAA